LKSGNGEEIIKDNFLISNTFKKKNKKDLTPLIIEMIATKP